MEMMFFFTLFFVFLLRISKLFRSRGLSLFVGSLCALSYAFYTDTTYDIDIFDSDSGIMALHCYQVSGICLYLDNFYFVLSTQISFANDIEQC